MKNGFLSVQFKNSSSQICTWPKTSTFRWSEWEKTNFEKILIPEPSQIRKTVNVLCCIQSYALLQRKQSKPHSISCGICVNTDQNLYEGSEYIQLCEWWLHLTADGDLPGSRFNSKQQTAPAVIDRLRAPVFQTALWFWRLGKSATKQGPPISSEPNIVRVAPAPMLLSRWNAGTLRITGFPKIRPRPL